MKEAERDLWVILRIPATMHCVEEYLPTLIPPSRFLSEIVSSQVGKAISQLVGDCSGLRYAMGWVNG